MNNAYMMKGTSKVCRSDRIRKYSDSDTNMSGACCVRRRVSSVVQHSSANPKVPGSILGLVSYGVMDYGEACFMHLTPRLWVYRISVPYAQKNPRFLFAKRRGQPREFWSLVSTIDYHLLYTTPRLCGRTAMLNTK